jgi:hypothetical protein
MSGSTKEKRPSRNAGYSAPTPHTPDTQWGGGGKGEPSQTKRESACAEHRPTPPYSHLHPAPHMQHQPLTCKDPIRCTVGPPGAVMAAHVVFAVSHENAPALYRRQECRYSSTPVASYHRVQSEYVAGHTSALNRPLSQPVAHVVHVAAPGEEYGVAGGHWVHTDAPAVEYRPAGQGPQVAVAGAGVVPAGHGASPANTRCMVFVTGAPTRSWDERGERRGGGADAG